VQPDRSLYSRQQLGELAGLDNTTLNYWSREGLLVPSEGGQGRGSHRRFDFIQVNIAAILGQMRRFKLSLQVMRSFAELLQKAVVLGAGRDLHPGNYVSAANLADRLNEFRMGLPVRVHAHPVSEPRPENLKRTEYLEWVSERRAAVSEAEIVEELIGYKSDYDTVEEILAFADAIGPGRVLEAQLYADLVYDILAPGYSGGYSWLLGFGPDESWKVEFGSEANFFGSADLGAVEAFGPGIFLPVSGIIRQLWGLKSPSEYMRDRRADRIQERLAEAGIHATVTLSDGPEESYAVDAPGVEWARVEAELDKIGYRSAASEKGQAE
jgi:DNA-binding transcriptional MerR regulator